MVLRKERAVALDAVRCCEEFLRCGGSDFVGDGFAGDGVEMGPVLDFEDPACERVDVEAC